MKLTTVRDIFGTIGVGTVVMVIAIAFDKLVLGN